MYPLSSYFNIEGFLKIKFARDVQIWRLEKDTCLSSRSFASYPLFLFPFLFANKSRITMQKRRALFSFHDRVTLLGDGGIHVQEEQSLLQLLPGGQKQNKQTNVAKKAPSQGKSWFAHKWAFRGKTINLLTSFMSIRVSKETSEDEENSWQIESKQKCVYF